MFSLKNLFRKRKTNRLLKVYRAVNQAEAAAFQTKDLIDFLLSEMDTLGVQPTNFYALGPYPNDGWTTRAGFLKGLQKKAYQHIHTLFISTEGDQLFLNFNNWAHNRTEVVERDAISLELMIDEAIISIADLCALGKRLYAHFSFQYGYIFQQKAGYSITEGKMKYGLLSYSERENPLYNKWQRYESAVQAGYLRSIYNLNFLSEAHLAQAPLRAIIGQGIGQLESQEGFTIWRLSDQEVDKVLAKLQHSPLIVENMAFDQTEICAAINREIKKLS